MCVCRNVMKKKMPNGVINWKRTKSNGSTNSTIISNALPLFFLKTCFDFCVTKTDCVYLWLKLGTAYAWRRLKSWTAIVEQWNRKILFEKTSMGKKTCATLQLSTLECIIELRLIKACTESPQKTNHFFHSVVTKRQAPNCFIHSSPISRRGTVFILHIYHEMDYIRGTR